MKYVEKNGVSRATRKYNKSRSYIYFWKARYDGSMESLAYRSRRPHSHPNQHTEAEIKLIRDIRRRNPELGMIELWHRLRKRGYTRRPESLYRVMIRLGMFQAAKQKKRYVPKPYEQMTYPGQRVQIDVKHVPATCLVGAAKGMKFYQYTAIDEFSRLRYIEAFEEASSYSSALFLQNALTFYAKHGFSIECVQTDNGSEFTNRFNRSKRQRPTHFELSADLLGVKHKLIRPYTPRHNGKVERSHREDNKRFYSSHRFYSFHDFAKQLNTHLKRSNSIPMRPLHWLSPLDYITVQYL
jgi:transposase InsO family protein